MSEAQERRTSRRVSIFLPVRSTVEAPGTGRKIAGRTEDIAASGLRLRLECDPGLKPGDRVYVRLDTLRDDGFINLQGEIRWLRPLEGPDGAFEAGIHLSGLDLETWDRWMDLFGPI